LAPVPLTSAGNKAHEDLAPGLIPTSPVIEEVGTSVIAWSDSMANLEEVPRTTAAWVIPPVTVGIAVGITTGPEELVFLHPWENMPKDITSKPQKIKSNNFFIFSSIFLS
jgi:hypothetical protein